MTLQEEGETVRMERRLATMEKELAYKEEGACSPFSAEKKQTETSPTCAPANSNARSESREQEKGTSGREKNVQRVGRSGAGTTGTAHRKSVDAEAS